MKEFECFGLDTANQCLLRGGAPIDLAPKPFAVLRYMVENPGRLITHDELLDALWPETYVQPQVLRTYVLELRKVLGDDAGQPRFIQTLPKRGYRFVAPVTEQAGPQGTSPERTSPQPNTSTAWAVQENKDAEVVGRDGELARLHAQVQQLASGQRAAVFVTGEAGIGKTALVDTFCRQLILSMAVSVARGQCVQGIGGKEEYYPVAEALSQLCTGPDGDAACRTLAKMAPAWLAHGPGFTPGQGLDATDTASGRPPAQERKLGNLCGALEELAADKPLVLVFEDLHWADDSTLNLISALARRRARAKLMILATYCPRSGSKEDPLKALKQDLLMRRLCVEMALAPLNRTAVRQLLGRELAQQTLPPGLADFVSQRSEGNPLFVIAVLENLIAQGVLARGSAGSDAPWEQLAPFPETEAGVPDQLARMIDLEIERLSEDEQRLLEAGSLMSVAFPAWAVAAALQKDAVETEEACDGLARRLHFVVRAGQDELPDGTRSAFYVLAHGLYRDVLYQRQAEARRARRHIRIAERLGELFAGREVDVARERAMHYEAAGDRKRAASVLESAAIAAQPPAGVC
ncbi:MAG TPA: AAA family ATPase [Terracidiphilus sp.]|jgi:DNA-binding winged helix-turn-helix (wHTH) protein